MSTLICFGFGYCAEHFVAAFGQNFDRIVGTVRGGERAAILNAYHAGKPQAVVFDGTQAAPELQSAIAEAAYVLVSVPPGEDGDPVIAALGDRFAAAKSLRSIVYLSTVGVYGDHGGAWVDEQMPPKPASARSRERLAAEEAWQDLGAKRGIAVAILRLAGIYGPGQNALIQIARGKARRIVKPGQIFNRIHVADIAQAIDAAIRARGFRYLQRRRRRTVAARRSARLCGSAHGRRAAAGNFIRGGRAHDVAAGFEFLAGVPAGEERQA